jgi:rhodanese-related sulfurtransferase
MIKKFAITILIIICAYCENAYAQELSFEKYISNFDYQSRVDMKIDSAALVKGIKEGKIQLVDIRFKEEYEAWRMGFATNIPLNELPARIGELAKDKIIVTACPHKDRSALAMAYLRTKGFNSKYLTDGLVGLAEYLRGDKAREFIQQYNK